MISIFSKKKSLALAALFLFAILLALPVFFINFFDDAYIHGRLVEKLLEQGVPFFNDGENFKAGSSTGYIYLLSVVSHTSGLEPISAIRLVEGIVIFLSTISIFWLANIAAPNTIRGKITAALALPSILLAAYGGMETPVFCLLIIWAAIAFSSKKNYLSIFFLSLATAFRFEAILLWFAFCFFSWKKEKKSLILLCSVPFFLLVFFELSLYGSIIPHAAKVKSVAYGFPLFQSVFNALTLNMGMGIKGLLVAILLVTFFSIRLLFIVENKFRINFSDIYIGFSGLVLSIWAFGKSIIFPWYLCLFIVPFIIGSLLDKNGRTGYMNQGYSVINIMLLLIFATIPIRQLLKDNSNQRVGYYLKIGAGLYSTCKSCSLLTSEIGGLGYSYKGVVYDAFGLGDPGASKFHPMKVPEERQDYGVGAIPPKYVELRRPDFIVSMPVFSVALRKSEVINRYYSYDCPMISNVFGDNIIQIFSKIQIQLNVLSTMGCQQTLKKSLFYNPFRLR